MPPTSGRLCVSYYSQVYGSSCPRSVPTGLHRVFVDATTGYTPNGPNVGEGNDPLLTGHLSEVIPTSLEECRPGSSFPPGGGVKGVLTDRARDFRGTGTFGVSDPVWVCKPLECNGSDRIPLNPGRRLPLLLLTDPYFRFKETMRV